MAQRVLAALALRGGVHLLLVQLQLEVLDTAPEVLGTARDVPPPPPLTTDVLEAALGALVAYFRVAPLEVSLAAAELEAEAWLVARIPSWARVQAPNTAPLMSRSVCDALLLLATSMSDPYERRPELGRAAIPSVLRPYPRAVPHPPSQSTWTSRPRQGFRPRRRFRRRPRRRRPCLRHPYHPYQPNHPYPPRHLVHAAPSRAHQIRRRRGRLRSRQWRRQRQH